MSLIQDLKYSEELDCQIGKVHLTLFNTDVEVMFENNVSIDYVEACVKHLNNLNPHVINVLGDRLNKYYQFMLKEWQEMGIYESLVASIKNKISEKVNNQTILQHIHPNTLAIESPKENIPAYSLDCNCDWELEHGAEIIIRNDKVLYVGSFSALGPWCNDNEYKCMY